jgi:type II secretory pathway pseudopilin PulG
MKRFVVNDWIPRIKYGAGLLEFTPAKAGAGMTKNHKGFTLIEIIILIVMAGILLPAIIVPFVTGVKGSGQPEMVTTAMYLAHQKMEEFMKYHYCNAALNPTALTAWANSDISTYQWQWSIYYVDSNFANPVPTPDSGYKRIIVRVRDPMLSIYEIYSVVTRW